MARGLLLVVDQFEELFALCRSEEEKALFISRLLTAASEADGPVILVITLRADFYASCANYPQLRQALAQQQEYIGAMGDQEIKARPIEEPAERGRWEFEPGLVDLLLHDIGADAGHTPEPGALPLLSHALLETWQRRRGRTMTLSGYTSSGGVRGAIAETAEAVFADQFTQEQQAIARRIFLRLTELGDESGAGDTRRRATFEELILRPEETANTQTVLKALADARLITTSEDAAEVAHEALIREWPTLHGWLEENREWLRLHRQLTEAAGEWLAADRDADLLYRGARLAQLGEWAITHADEMNPLEREFLDASQAWAERKTAERQAQKQRELEAAQKLAEAEKHRAEQERRTSGQLRRRAVFTRLGTGFGHRCRVAAGMFANRNASPGGAERRKRQVRQHPAGRRRGRSRRARHPTGYCRRGSHGARHPAGIGRKRSASPGGRRSHCPPGARPGAGSTPGRRSQQSEAQQRRPKLDCLTRHPVYDHAIHAVRGRRVIQSEHPPGPATRVQRPHRFYTWGRHIARW